MKKTFQYIFNHLKKGIYVSIRDNELFTFLPFNNIRYENTWSELLERSDKNIFDSKIRVIMTERLNLL
jgi:hypothetical protein